MKVLYLTPWYPSERDAMAGLFVQKHVEAVQAQGVDVRVIHSEGWADLHRQWRQLKREWGLPDVVQLNVVQKQGLLAHRLKRKYGIPYIIVEHWSGYLPENGQYMQMSVAKHRLYARIVRDASMLLCVSNRLADAMRTCGLQNARTSKINNVVDDFFYQKPAVESPKSKVESVKTLLHVSCFDERAKNVKGLLRAAKLLSAKRSDWRLVLVGTGIDYQAVRAYADSLNLPEELLHWTGELTPQQVSDEMDKADMFVLPSNYENAPVVLSESLAKGLPIIATRVGGIPEMVNAENGLLVAPGDDTELAQAMEQMLDHYQEYDREAIRKAGKQYSYATVGAELKQIYETVR
ncbi:MAG: glycosyltransferase [Paludibacteraceae bacterium]|nr:glycosyltransferase [Paludibacteraceae bacterium]